MALLYLCIFWLKAALFERWHACVDIRIILKQPMIVPNAMVWCYCCLVVAGIAVFSWSIVSLLAILLGWGGWISKKQPASWVHHDHSIRPLLKLLLGWVKSPLGVGCCIEKHKQSQLLCACGPCCFRAVHFWFDLPELVVAAVVAWLSLHSGSWSP